MRKVVLWGHQVDEYQAMFDLSPDVILGHLLEFGCGPSAVNATLTERGQAIVSVDPLFSHELSHLRQETQVLFDDRVAQIMAHQNQFDVREYGGMDAFIANRRAGMQRFFADYAAGALAARYLAYSGLPLPFTDFSFDMALVSHFLFTNASSQSVDDHLAIISELARVAHEVRVFPLIGTAGVPSELLGPVLLGLQQRNYGVEVREVGYALYPQGNAMLRVWAKQCIVSA